MSERQSIPAHFVAMAWAVAVWLPVCGVGVLVAAWRYPTMLDRQLQTTPALDFIFGMAALLAGLTTALLISLRGFRPFAPGEKPDSLRWKRSFGAKDLFWLGLAAAVWVVFWWTCPRLALVF